MSGPHETGATPMVAAPPSGGGGGVGGRDVWERLGSLTASQSATDSKATLAHERIDRVRSELGAQLGDVQADVAATREELTKLRTVLVVVAAAAPFAADFLMTFLRGLGGG